MTDKEFRAEIKSGLSGGYLIYGDEEYLKNYLVKLAVKSVVGDDDFSAVNIIETDENSYDDSFLENALASVPVMAEKCCAVCRVRFSELKEERKEIIYSALDLLKNNPQVVLIFFIPSGYFDEGNLKKNNPSADYKKLTGYLSPVGVPYQTASVLKKWVAKHLVSDGLTADDTVLSHFIDVAGFDMTALSGEIEKLTCYVLSKNENEVTKEAVDFVCSENGELDAFALSNAVVSGNRGTALEALKECRDKKQKATSVIARMTSEFMNMLTVAVCMKNGMLRSDISKKLGMHEFRVGKYMEAIRDVEIPAIRAVIDRSVEIDAALKSSGGGYELLERFVCTIPSKKKIAKVYR